MVRTIYVVAAAVIITALVVGGLGYYFLRPPPAADVLEIYHWWTSGGEAAAINALVAYFQTQYNITVIQSPVAGGAGYVFKAVIKPLVLAGEAPDSFQLHAGYEGRPYYDGGYLDPITSLYADQGWEDVFPKVVLDMVKFGNDYYAVPLDIHRSNVVWYNKPILTSNGIDPATLTTWDAFFAACDKLVTSGGMAHPIVLGDSGPWAAAHVLEQMIAGEGIGFYQDWVNGKITSGTNTTMRDALQKFAKYLSYVNDDHATLTWDQATARIITGTAAFNIMGDWANGEFTKANKVYGTDYGTFLVPGTSGYYGLVVDCFEHPKGVKHPGNSLDWLKIVGSKAGQDAFNPLKGSISPRSDSDTTKYGAYQQSAITDFRAAAHMYPSVTHGSGAPESFTTDWVTIVSTFVSNKDVNAAATALANSASTHAADYTKVWAL